MAHLAVMSIDLRSDTVTQPGAAMRQAMANAKVGDDVLDGDPTVALLQERVADLLGKDQALFFPTGTMANQAALWLLGSRGTELLLDADAHIAHWELAGAAALAGLQLRPVRGDGLVMDAEALRRTIRPPSPNAPRATLVCVENTHNGAGGVVTPLADLRAISDVAREHGLPVHLDGARLWNAAIATGTSLAEFAACADTVMVSFSKGLGAPVGAVLAGDGAEMADAWVVRKRFGGGMRQSGILAAGALYGLENNLMRLAEDHENARRVADRVEGVGGARVVAPDTNIVMIDLAPGISAAEVVKRTADRGVKISAWSPTRLRAVTHLDVGRADAEAAADTLAEILGEMA